MQCFGGIAMTMHADQLVGAPVIDSDGRGVGTVEQVFRDDVDGTPSWARIRSAKGLHFVPLAGGKVTREGGLSVAFDEQKILSEPDISVDRHMSVDQEEELRRYFGLSIPAQAGRPGVGKPGAGGQPPAGRGSVGLVGPARRSRSRLSRSRRRRRRPSRRRLSQRRLRLGRVSRVSRADRVRQVRRGRRLASRRSPSQRPPARPSRVVPRVRRARRDRRARRVRWARPRPGWTGNRHRPRTSPPSSG